MNLQGKEENSGVFEVMTDALELVGPARSPGRRRRTWNVVLLLEGVARAEDTV